MLLCKIGGRTKVLSTYSFTLCTIYTWKHSISASTNWRLGPPSRRSESAIWTRITGITTPCKSLTSSRPSWIPSSFATGLSKSQAHYKAVEPRRTLSLFLLTTAQKTKSVGVQTIAAGEGEKHVIRPNWFRKKYIQRRITESTLSRPEGHVPKYSTAKGGATGKKTPL